MNLVPFHIWSVNLKVRLTGEALFHLLFWMYFPFITVYFSEALGSHTAGLLMTVPPLFSMVGHLLGGSLADRLGRRPVMLLGAALQAGMFALFALSPSPWLDYAAFIGLGLGGAFYKPAGAAMVADLVPAPDRRRVFAAFATANNVGAVLGPALGAVFFFHYRQELLWTCTVVLLLYWAAMYFVVRETLPPSAKTQADPSPLVLVFRQQWKGYGVILKDRVFLLYIAAGILALIPIMQLDLYLAVYVTEYVPAQALFAWKEDSPVVSGTEIYGWLLGFNGLLFVLLILPVTKWLSPWSERSVFILSSLLSGIGTFSLGLSPHLEFLFFATFLFTLGEIVRSPVTQSFISRYAPEDARGQYLGADSLQNTIARFLAPLTVFLSGWVPPMGIFSLILMSSLISIVLYIRLFRIYSHATRDCEGLKA
ncbi:MDR family MFS transporter [Paenibacillus caseinilyticus]|uniref:MFS transporter n=1 Tax=Paenibacillus mucilaginosus K02 TaxID=997761 RepID=I0BEH7_9BACL|nr:MFS transporter [Paenibacillus mucilaginosus]AFH60774.2 MFS transporter [Paenibacillus mucilaginosus K02]